MKINAFNLLLKQKRFDLIFKYLYLKNKDKNIKFFEDLYVEHIRAFTFNKFHEEKPSDGIPKETKEDFINSFNRLYDNMLKKGFDKKTSVIPMGENGDILDGAHRLTCAAVLGLDVEIKREPRSHLFDYKFFKKFSPIDSYYADYAAMEYVKLNPNSYIVNIQSIVPTKFDSQIENILEKYGFIFYKKYVDITFNGLVNLKKLSYGSVWEKNKKWIGNAENGFAGAADNAKKSFNKKNPLRAYVFVCESLQDVLTAKEEIRTLLKIGKFSVHINDTHEEAISLAQIYFNKNTLQMINNRPYKYEDKKFDDMVMELYNTAHDKNINLNDVCGAGSTTLDIYAIRQSKDFDFLYCGDKKFNLKTETLANHDSEIKYYPESKQNIITTPKYHFYYKGIKFISLEVLYLMKQKRHEKPKDVKDCKNIKKFLKRAKYKTFKIFQKIYDGKTTIYIFFNSIKITHTKH